MNKDLEVFENRKDDWLAKERKHEESVSAWDIDDSSKLKQQHLDNCEAKLIKDEHARRHMQYNVYQNSQFKDIDENFTKKVIAAIGIGITTISIISLILSSTDSKEFYYATAVTLLIIFVNIINKKGKK